MSKDTISVNMNIYDIPILVEQLKKLDQENKHLNLQLDQALKDYEELLIKIDKAIDWCDEIIRTFCEDDKQVVVAYEIKEILGDKENEET